MKECPYCKWDAGLFVIEPLVIHEGHVVVKRVPAFCNNPSCNGRFWWFPARHRVTKRHTGPTYHDSP